MGESLQVRIWQHASALDPAENLAALDRAEDMLAGTDLLVLPEAFARDFGEQGSDLAPYAEPLDGPFGSKVAQLARSAGAHMVAGMFESSPDPARPFNTLVLAGPEQVTPYRKIHLYDSFGYRESDRVHPGPIEPTVVPVTAARVGLLTCYDLRFPEQARALSAAGADLLVLPAAWVAGDRKLAHWQTLVRARAIENVAWVVAAAQPGPRYTGHSMVVAPTGDVVAEAGGEDDVVLTETLDLEAVRVARERNPSLANRRM